MLNVRNTVPPWNSENGQKLKRQRELRLILDKAESAWITHLHFCSKDHTYSICPSDPPPYDVENRLFKEYSIAWHGWNESF